MIVYQTDLDGYYLHPTQATVDPEETRIQGKTVWAIPGGCVTKEPPAQKKNHLLRWMGGKWTHEHIPTPKPAPKQEEPVVVEPKTAAERLAVFLQADPEVRKLVGL